MPTYLITGASRNGGIGLEYVKQLSDQPHNLVFGLVRNKEKSTGLVDLAQSRRNVRILEADLSDSKSIQRAAEEVSQVTKCLDVLINNAAFIENTRTEGLADYPSQEILNAELRDSFAVNVIGVVDTINAFLPLLYQSNVKKVIAISTCLADEEFTRKAGLPIFPGYSISKAALNFTIAKYAADGDLQDHGFKFLALSPGVVDTGVAPTDTKDQKEFYGRIASGFKKAQVDWDMQPISTEVSVRDQLKVIEELDMEKSGRFLSHHGNTIWL